MLALRRAAVGSPFAARGVAFAAAKTQPKTTNGLRKSEEEYTLSAHGVRYPGTSESLAPAKKFLGIYTLSEDLLRQCLVHKSFAHGKFPYNEKLAELGQQLLRLEASRSALEEAETAQKDTTVNGKNFDIGSNALEVLTSTPVVAKVCDLAQLEPALFYKATESAAPLKVKARAINALLGGLVLEKGEAEATKFAQDRLLSGQFSVFDLASEVSVHTS